MPATVPDQPTGPTDRAAAALRRTERVCGGLAILGLVIGGLGVVQDSEMIVVGAMVIAAGLTGVVAAPAGFALGIGVRRPGALPGPARVAALLVGLAGAWVGWSVLGAHTPRAIPVGAALMVTGLLAASVALRPPWPRPWPLPAGTLLAGLLVYVITRIIPMFDGTKPRAYYLGMQRAMQGVATWQQAVRADSGRYATALDTSQVWDAATVVRSGGMVGFEATADGYRAWTTTPLAPGRCAVFEGSAAEAPAVSPGVAACTPYPEWRRAAFGELWLAALVLTALASLLVNSRSVEA
jgi:hypothetical protein